MKTKIESYVEYELTIGSVELGEIIDALNELRYNSDLGAINLQFGVKSSNVNENVNIKFVHAEKAEALAQAVIDEAAEDNESCGSISEEDWDAIFSALGIEDTQV